MSQIEPNKVDIIKVLRNNRLNQRSNTILGGALAFIVLTVIVAVWQPIGRADERTVCRFIDNDLREKMMYVEDGPCPDYAYTETWVQTGTVSTPFQRQEAYWKEKMRAAAADRARAIDAYHRMVVERELAVHAELRKQNAREKGE